MNNLSPSLFNEPISIFETNPSFHSNSFSQQQQPLVDTSSSSQSQFTIMMNNYGGNKAPSADDFAMGGGSKGNMIPLPLDFTPGQYDVLCGRGKKNYDSQGNQRLRRIVESYVERYSSATSRQDKSDILSAIVDEVRSATGSPMGGFIKQDASGRWFEVGDFLAREKVSQAFRDALSDNYRSSKKFKHEKRRQRDKAAKAAKQKDGGSGKDGDKKPAATKKGKKKSAPAGSHPLLMRQSLSVLREEITGGQAEVQTSRPGRVTSLAHGSSAPAFSQGFNNSLRPGIGDQLVTHAGFPSSFNNQSAQGQSSHEHTPSWSQGYQSNNPIYNPIHSGNSLPMSNIAMSQQQHQQQRRFSDSMMTNQAPFSFEQQQRSNFNNNNWVEQQQMQQQMNARAFGVGVANANAPDLNASFPSGLSMGMVQRTQIQSTGMFGQAQATNGMMSSEGTGFSPMQLYLQQQQQQQMATEASLLAGGSSSRSMVQSGGGNRRRLASPLLRSGSNVSTSSGAGTAIVERLESVLPAFSNEDENPFEPVPLPHENNNDQANNHGGDDDDHSIHPFW